METLNINLNLLKSFWAVYNTGGINKGARFLGLTTPVVAYNLKQLEKQLDRKLFVAHKKGVDPTGEASLIYPLVENIFDNLRKCNEQLYTTSSGVIKLGTTTIYASFFLVKFVQDFNKKYPNIKLEFHHHPQHEYLSMLENNEIDIAMSQNMQRPDQQRINIFELKKHSMVFFAAKQFAAEHKIKEELTPEQFHELPFILFSAKDKSFLTKMENWFGRKLNAIETHTAHAAYDMVMDGKGIGFFFDEYLDTKRSNQIVKLKIADMPAPPPSIYECAHHKKPSAIVSLFISELKDFYEKQCS